MLETSLKIIKVEMFMESHDSKKWDPLGTGPRTLILLSRRRKEGNVVVVTAFVYISLYSVLKPDIKGTQCHGQAYFSLKSK